MPARTATNLPDAATPAIDSYIAKAEPFAQPVLQHLRDAVHRAAPNAVEAIKWSRPFFVLHGVILANMAAFKHHCSFGLWGTAMAETLRTEGVNSSEGMGTFGRITTVADLPPAAALEGYIRHAAGLIEDGTRTRSIQRVAKARSTPREELPPALLEALGKDQAAAANFASFSPSCRREYIDWIAGAKRDDTRTRRVNEALAMIAAGKSRHWKYESPGRHASRSPAHEQARG